MTLLFRILRAAHARGTHHKLALDALQHLRGAEAEGWRRLFLEHAQLYMQGAKAPDDEFKDFKNHVLHVRDGFWGGAPDKVASWYANLVDGLKGGRWSEAVWAAGVLSHYYTDPIHPFHTGQTEAENNIHRAVEWSINRSYDDLKRLGDSEFSRLRPEPSAEGDWLRAFVVEGAETSNRSYEKLIAHYDIGKGVVDPPAGLDMVGRRLVAELLRYASTGFAGVLERAIAEAAVSPPKVNLAVDTILAALQIPIKTLAKRMADDADRKLVQLMFDELKTTGRVEVHLPEDDRMVRDLFTREVVQPQEALRAAQRAAFVAAAPANGVGPVRGVRAAVAAVSAPPAPAGSGRAAGLAGGAAVSLSGGQSGGEGAEPALAALSLSRLQRPQADSTSERPPSTVVATAELSLAAGDPGLVSTGGEGEAPAGERIRRLGVIVGGEAADRARRVHLSADDDVERAPSIGPKTAERLYAVGIRTVAEFLAAEPVALAGAVDVRHVSATTIASWQDQCRLVMTVAGLRGTHAQLLVGAGYRDAAALAAADLEDLNAAVLAFAATADGHRVLREGHPPDMEKIAGWIAAARERAAA